MCKPGRGGVEIVLQGGRDHPSLNPGAQHFALTSRESRCLFRGRKVQGLRPSAALGASLGVAQSAKEMCQVKPVTPLLPPVLRGTASPCSTWLLFLHTSAGKNPARSVPGIQEAVLRLRSGLLAQRVRDALPQTRQAIHPATPRPGFPQPPALPATSPRTTALTAPVGTVSARPSAWIVFPSFRPCYGPFRPRRRRESAFRTSCRSLPGAGSLRSPIPCTVKARQANPSRHPPGSSGRQAAGHWWLGDSAPHSPAAPDTPNHQRLQGDSRFRTIKKPTGITRPMG